MLESTTDIAVFYKSTQNATKPFTLQYDFLIGDCLELEKSIL